MAELVPGVGAVDAGRLVKLGIHALQAGKVDHHVIAHVLPDGEQDDRDHCPILVGRPAGEVCRIEAERYQQHVERAHGWIEDHVPDHSDRHERGNIGKEHDGAEEIAAEDLLVEQHRQKQRADQRQRNGQRRVDKGVPECRLEHVVGEQTPEVPEPDEGHLVRAVPVHEGQCECEQDRPERENCETNEVRGDEAVGDEIVAQPPTSGCHGARLASWSDNRHCFLPGNLAFSLFVNLCSRNFQQFPLFAGP